LRHLNPDTAPRLAHPAPHLGFNYLGRFTADTAEGTDHHWISVGEVGEGAALGEAEMPFGHALEINAATYDGPDGPRLTIDLAWPAALFDRAEVERLAELWQQALRAIHTHAENPDAGGLTPSDLTLVGLSQQHIDLLEAKLRK
ncbi:hypothetical protein AB0K51_34130, partial [Kitasatospora sp. NPDC049285]|uniref:hypothetical protein n=1 Tax=Kitasatospora sp. NPDC049285 TaxID=3157096 RepID=UPI00342B0224